MRQMIKSFLCFGLLMLGLQGAWAFSLLGPELFGDVWQIPEIGFNPLLDANAPPFILDSLPAGPKNLGEEYRRNTPVIYYACNANFLDYFGSNGVAAVDGAFAILNNAFTNNPLTGEYLANGVDSYSPDLSEFPLQALGLNYSAFAADLLDLKSTTLHLLVEQLGLADAVRYTWVIHDRYQEPGTTCPIGLDYTVTMRNFDITASPLNQLQYSPYINGVFYDYYIPVDLCDKAPPAPPTVDALEAPVDPLAAFYEAPVASGGGVDGLVQGYYYTGLTRDDVAGLRYLLSSNNINYESATPNSILVGSSGSSGTNYGPPFLLYTSNYTAFAAAALTNDPTTLATLFPGLVISSSSYYFTNIVVPTFVAYYTNSFVLGNPPVLVIKSNGFSNIQLPIYSYTFANLIFVTNAGGFHTNTSAQLVTVQVSQGGVLGNPFVTNTTTKSIILTNVPSADYYISTNPCGPNLILSTLATNVVATTNVILAASNSAGYFYSQSIVTYTTNHIYVAQPLICGTVVTGAVANATSLYQGIQKIQFVHKDFDSLLGRFFQPITNNYRMVAVTNYLPVGQNFQRVVTAPDILFSAADQVSGPNARVNWNTSTRNVNFGTANVYAGLAGPGTIDPSSTITFDKSVPVYVNQSPYYLNGYNSTVDYSFIWASFDGTTNDPVVYPNGASIQNLVNQIIIQIYSTPTVLPVGTNGSSYDATFSVTGGQSPYTWSLAPGSPSLPLGLTLSQTNDANGIISGTPTNNLSGTHDFTIQLKDAGARTVLLNYFITIQ
jgi:hypothetical protein